MPFRIRNAGSCQSSVNQPRILRAHLFAVVADEEGELCVLNVGARGAVGEPSKRVPTGAARAVPRVRAAQLTQEGAAEPDGGGGARLGEPERAPCRCGHCAD
eukprot:6210794-Pleurochrysis_carterae.AAC.1